jgi:hypothetical protein
MRAMREHSRARDTTKAVGVAVASYVSIETGLAWPSNEQLMAWGWADRTIQRSLRQLEALGELQRVPEMEDPRRPRVYRLPLAFQTSLLDTSGERGDMVVSPVTVTPDLHVSPDGLTRVREGTLEPQTSGTSSPQSPPDGGAVSGLPSGLIEGPTPRAALSERDAGARRRRSRRRRGRREPSSVALASGPCPLRALPDDEVSRLQQRWDPLREALAATLGEDTVAIWFSQAHIHSAGDRLEIGLSPSKVRWTQGRYRITLSRLSEVAGAPVLFVPCEPAGLFASTEAAS